MKLQVMRDHYILTIVVLAAVIASIGCGDPELFSLTGKVTLGGEAKERLIVYFDPINAEVNKFNLGVGETDKEGNLTLRSTAGNGLATGNYRVSFTYPVSESGQSAGLSDDKNEETSAESVEMVPEPYCNRQSSPIEFYIKRAANEFTYDIPLN